MKLYYCTKDVTPNDQDYFILEANPDGSFVADMETPVYRQAQVIDWSTAKRIKELHGTGFTAVVEVPNMFSVTRFISFVDGLGCTHAHRYYVPALSPDFVKAVQSM